MRFPHTHFAKGKRVRIVTKDGEIRLRRFVERIARAIVVDNDETGERTKIDTKHLKNVTYWKLP